MKTKDKKFLILLGSVPPPYHGSNVSFQRVLNSNIGDFFHIDHIDSSDHRDSSNLGKLDFWNVFLGLKTLLQVIIKLTRHRPDAFYICIAQEPLAYLRDGLFIIAVKWLSPKTKVIVHLRGSYFLEFYTRSPFFMKKYIDFSMGLVSNAIVLGNGLRFIFKKWLSDDHIYVVPNGTDLSPDLGSKFESVGYHRPLHLLYLSTLIRSKGVFDAIDVVKKFKKTYGEILLHVAGERNVKDPYDGQDRTPALFENLRDPEVLDSIKDLGVITGKVKEKELVDADILLLPTCYPYEGLPNVILEAMAAGCVVISTYHAAIPEVVLDGETGFLVEKNQPEQLLKCVKRLHEDRALLKKMMIASRNRYQALYTAKKSNDLLIETLAKCVN